MGAKSAYWLTIGNPAVCLSEWKRTPSTFARSAAIPERSETEFTWTPFLSGVANTKGDESVLAGYGPLGFEERLHAADSNETVLHALAVLAVNLRPRGEPAAELVRSSRRARPWILQDMSVRREWQCEVADRSDLEPGYQKRKLSNRAAWARIRPTHL